MSAPVMHRHSPPSVDHVLSDHHHGVCSEHAHWAVGRHPEGVSLEVSTPHNDPSGWGVVIKKIEKVSDNV